MKTEKQITRTITVYTGEELRPNFQTMTFDVIPFTVYEEEKIPVNHRNLQSVETVYTMGISEFVKYGKKVEKNG